MPLVINTNMPSLNAQRNLQGTQNTLASSLQRLSSGLRVNSAKDDAAGLYQAELQTADIRGVNQAVRNANDGISLSQTAEGALGQVGNMLQRIREISVQSANGSVSDAARTGLQAEVDQLTQEISRIVQTTEYGGFGLLNSATGITFQIGQNGAANQQLTVSGVDLTAGGALNAYAAGLTATGTVDVSTQAAASASIANVQADIQTIATNRATFGAVQNRFEAVIANLQNYAENLTSARSRILDADFAAETANLTKAQILQQAGVAILAQANAIPQTALTLLQ